MHIRPYDHEKDHKGWVYTKALSYLFSPFFDDFDRENAELD